MTQTRTTDCPTVAATRALLEYWNKLGRGDGIHGVQLRRVLDQPADHLAHQEISVHVAATTLYHHGVTGPPAYPPSGWRHQLLNLIIRSDDENRTRLALGFPAEVAAVRLAERKNGLLALHVIAGTLDFVTISNSDEGEDGESH